MNRRTTSKLDLGQAFQRVTSILSRNANVERGVNQLIDFCEKRHPHASWNKLRAIDYSGGNAAVQTWVTGLLLDEPPQEGIKALWFGIFTPSVRGKPTADMYLGGWRSFDPDQHPSQCDYWPDGRYAQSKVMAEIYQIAYRRGGLGNSAEYPLCLGFAAFAVRHLCRNAAPQLILGRAKQRIVTVGFDSGDFVHIGTVTQGGFRAGNPVLEKAAHESSAANLYEIQDDREGNWCLDEPTETSGEYLPGGFAETCHVESLDLVASTVERPGNKTDFSLALCLGPPIVRAELVDTLRKIAPGDFQAIPVKVKRQRERYAVLNILSNRSWKPLLAWSKQNKKPVSHAPVGKYKILRVGDYPSTIVVTRDVKEFLEKRGVTGIQFVPLRQPEAWQVDRSL